MQAENDRPYVLHNDLECQRLEAQAVLARIEGHLRHLDIPEGARILDAGCGTGSMSRLFARRYPDATVVGVDVNPDYVAFARALAAEERLANLSFKVGSIQDLPFGAAEFDVTWSKYVLYFVPDPDKAVAEFRRVTKPGGTTLVVLNDLSGVVLDPPDGELRRRLDAVCDSLLHLSLPRRLPTMLLRSGFVDVSVELEADKVYTFVGPLDAGARANHATELAAGAVHAAQAVGGAAAYQAFTADWLAYLDRPDTCTIVPLWFVRGIAPP